MAGNGVVYVVDDDQSMCELAESTLVRAGLRVKTFPSAEEFAKFDVCADCGKEACCILLDVVMPGISGLDFLEQRYGGKAPCPVIMVTAKGSVRTAVKSMKLGAVDFLEKPFSPEDLTALVMSTLKHYQFDCEGASARATIRTRIAKLSPRERELLDSIVNGHSTKMIADRLGISARTIDHHRANMMEKMKAGNVADLVRMAVQGDYQSVRGGSVEETV